MLVALYIGCFHDFPERNFAPTFFIEEPEESYRSTEGDVYNDGTPIPFSLSESGLGESGFWRIRVFPFWFHAMARCCSIVHTGWRTRKPSAPTK